MTHSEATKFFPVIEANRRVTRRIPAVVNRVKLYSIFFNIARCIVRALVGGASIPSPLNSGSNISSKVLFKTECILPKARVFIVLLLDPRVIKVVF